MLKKFNITVNGASYEVEVEEIKDGVEPVAREQVARPKAAPVAPKKAPAAPKKAPVAAGAGSVTSPMPGTILDIKVAEGASVSKGDVLLILEAMKMENEIKAPADGTVASIDVAKGASVNTGDVLITIS